MHTAFQDFKFAPIRRDPPPRHCWSCLWLRMALVVLFGVLVGLLYMSRASAQTAMVNEPTCKRCADVRPFVRADMAAYLDGKTSYLGWSMHRVTAAQLASEYRANEVAAQRKYGDDSTIVIAGRVQQVAITFETPRIMLDGMVNAFMVKGAHDDWLATLKPGQQVQVACRRVRSALSLVGGHQCEPRDAYVAKMVELYFYSMAGLAKQGDTYAAYLLAEAGK